MGRAKRELRALKAVLRGFLGAERAGELERAARLWRKGDPRHLAIMSGYRDVSIGCTRGGPEEAGHILKEDPGCSLVPQDRSECESCSEKDR